MFKGIFSRPAKKSSPLMPDIRVFEEIVNMAWEIFWLEREGSIQFISPAFYDLTGYRPELYLGPTKNFHALIRELSEDRIDPSLPAPRSTLPFKHKSGERRHVRSRVFRTSRGETVGILEDITQEFLDREQLQYLASYDVLTGVFNRRGFEEYLNRELGERRVGVLVMDMDRFKEANDAYGHGFGDEILRQFAQRLDSVAPPESRIARLGGDEFAIALRMHGGNLAILDKLAGQIQDFSREAFLIEGTEIFIGVSIGTAWSDAGTLVAEDLLTHADLAMYQAKNLGKNQSASFSPALNEALHRKLFLARELSHAIERNQLRVVYQPQWDLETGSLAGLEALLRWTHPELGEISPLEFIPIAESSYLIQVIGEYVLWEACSQMQDWNKRFGTETRVAVNVSPLQLQKPGIESIVRRVLLDTELPPSCLELEVTENSLLDDSPRMLEVMNGLRSMGISLSLDDFGTEYASFNYLQQFQLHRLKVDKLFVRRFLENPNTSSIVGTIIQLGKNLNMRVLAEGVESEAQAQGLRALGCQEVQGFYYSHPREKEDIDRIMSGSLQPGT